MRASSGFETLERPFLYLLREYLAGANATAHARSANTRVNLNISNI